MQEQIALVITQLRMVWSHRWIALLTAAAVCVVGWAFVVTLPSSYSVNAKVFLDTSSMLRPVLQGLAIDTNSRQQAIEMVRRTLLTRPNLEAVARTTDLDLTAQTPEQFESLIDGLRSDIEIAGDQRQNIFTIAYEHEDPAVALRVVEVMLNSFVERSLGESRRDTSKTRQFVEQQVKEYEARLLAAEERLKEFRRRNVGLLPGDGQDFYSMREQNRAQLSEAELRLKEAQRRRDELERQILGEEPTFGIMPMPSYAARTTGPLSGRIQSLEQRLDELLLQYTEQHPDVISTRRLIEDLETQNQEYLEAQAVESAATGGTSLNENPVYQNLKLALGNAEAEVAALQARVEEYRERDKTFGQRIDQILAVEQELKALNRDYDITRRNYDEFVKRRESLSIADQAEKSADQVEFNIVEPPRMPLSPSSPDRVLLSAGVLVVGLGAGVGFAWVLTMLRPAFFSRDDLTSVSDLPVWGAVSRIMTPREKAKRRFGYAAFAGGLASLLAVFAVLEALHYMQVDIYSTVRSLVS